MTTAHTATPWQVNVTKMDGAITHWHIAGAKHGSAYPICSHTIEQEPTGAEQLENAAFIVRACNAHDDLVSVAQAILVDDLLPLLPAEYIAKVRAALAKAGAA